MSETSETQRSAPSNLADKKDSSSYYLDEYEIDLYDLLAVLWNQKFLILGTILIAVVSGFLYTLFAKPLYKITMQVRPPAESSYKGWTTEDIKRWIEEKQYLNLFDKLPGNPEYLKIRATTQRGSNIVTLTLLYPDPAEGKKILNSIYDRAREFYISKNGDPGAAQVKLRLENEIQNLERDLSAIDLVELPNLEITITRKIEHQKVLEKLMDVNNHQKEVYSSASSELSDLLSKISGSYVELARNVIGVASSKLDRVSALILQQILVQNVGYEGELIRQVTTFKARTLEIEEGILNLQKALIQLQQEIDQLKYKKEQFNLKKQQIMTEIEQKKAELQNLTVFEKIAGPVASLEPVKPQKLLILAVCGVLGMFSGILLAFVRHGWQKRSGL